MFEFPETNMMTGVMPYRFASSSSYGAIRFYPTAWNYILQNKRRNDNFFKKDSNCSTLELIDGSEIKFYIPLENFKEFYLTTHPRGEVLNDRRYTEYFYEKS